MTRCLYCKEVFEDDEIVYERVCWEDYYGVGNQFQTKSYGHVATCPFCGSEDLEDWEEDEGDEE